jgi:hypothetical protein
MITTPTVFILGAGASIPYGFPSGLDLVDMICGPAGDRKYIQFGVDQATAESFITALRQSDQQSVDEHEFQPEHVLALNPDRHNESF